MIIFNFEVPPKYVEKTGRGPVIFIVVLESENLERMKSGDPADLQLLEHLKGPMLNAPLKQLDLVIAYESDLGELIRLRNERDFWGIVRWLERGRKVKPGDCAPPLKIPSQKGEVN